MKHAIACALALTLLAVSPAAAQSQEPIEAIWEFNGGQVAVDRQADGSFIGTIIRPTQLSECTHQNGEQMWIEIRAQPDGQYYGRHQYFRTSDCSFIERGMIALRVLTNEQGATFLRVCFDDPELDPDEQPNIAPDGSNTTTQDGCRDSDLVSRQPPTPPKIDDIAVLPKSPTKGCFSRRSLPHPAQGADRRRAREREGHAEPQEHPRRAARGTPDRPGQPQGPAARAVHGGDHGPDRPRQDDPRLAQVPHLREEAQDRAGRPDLSARRPLAREVARRWPDLGPRADELISGGAVLVDGLVASNPRTLVDAGASLRIVETAQPLRGRVKLATALAVFGIDASGAVALDAGAAAGGFVQAWLDAGARRVYAVEAGHGQLLGSLRQDERVVNLERTNVGALDRTLVPDAVDAVSLDVGYLPLATAVPQLDALTFAPGAHLVGLVKPKDELALGELPADPASVVDEAVARASEGIARSGLGGRGDDAVAGHRLARRRRGAGARAPRRRVASSSAGATSSIAWARPRWKRPGVVPGARWSDWISTIGASRRSASARCIVGGTSRSIAQTTTAAGTSTSPIQARLSKRPMSRPASATCSGAPRRSSPTTHAVVSGSPLARRRTKTSHVQRGASRSQSWKTLIEIQTPRMIGLELNSELVAHRTTARSSSGWRSARTWAMAPPIE